MTRVVDVEAREGFAIWVRFDDGTAGKVDLDDLAGRGVFKSWADRRVFESVRSSGRATLTCALTLCTCD